MRRLCSGPRRICFEQSQRSRSRADLQRPAGDESIGRTGCAAARFHTDCTNRFNMKFLDEYRDPVMAEKVIEAIRRTVTKPWVLMEVCGGQTHSIVKYGIDHLLPREVELVHGPGCPVCVTSLEMID